ncbi:MAG: LysR family transcriptional regulator [Alphaproteobacteria bacterium]|nr:LysR family transcriptional regulator [Alphaproteobacteria bacterium]
MDLNLLPIFLAIFDTGSVSRAAEHLKLSQSGLSTSLNRLRTELDDPLFVRTGRGLKPTPRAQSLAQAVRAILGAVTSDVLRGENYDPSKEHGEFRISLTDVGETTFLPRLMPSLTSIAPLAVVRTLSLAASEVSRALEDGVVDIAFGDFSDFESATLMQQAIGSYSFSCLVRSDHPLAGKKLTKQQFSEFQHAVVETDIRTVRLLDAYFKKHRIDRKIALRNSHYLTLPLLIAKSDMIAIVADKLADQFLPLGLVKTVMPPFPMPTSYVTILWHRRLHNDQRNKWLRSMCIQALRRSGMMPKAKIPIRQQ